MGRQRHGVVAGGDGTGSRVTMTYGAAHAVQPGMRALWRGPDPGDRSQVGLSWAAGVGPAGPVRGVGRGQRQSRPLGPLRRGDLGYLTVIEPAEQVALGVPQLIEHAAHVGQRHACRRERIDGARMERCLAVAVDHRADS